VTSDSNASKAAIEVITGSGLAVTPSEQTSVSARAAYRELIALELSRGLNEMGVSGVN
jgi:hypothetical protein